jgi:hypothetical protein
LIWLLCKPQYIFVWAAVDETAAYFLFGISPADFADTAELGIACGN